MLDFIVLGMVPGTDFVITFWWSLVFGLSFWITVLIYIEFVKFRQNSFSHEGDKTLSIIVREINTGETNIPVNI